MKKNKTILFSLLILIFSSACSLLGIKTTEEAPFETVKKEGSFEIRQYPEILIAQVNAKGDWEEAQGDAFRDLFKYISGQNTSEQKISMTAPVLVQGEERSTKIEMTSPVLLSEKNDGMQMSFVLPKEYTLDTVPQPANPKVKIIELKGQKRLVYTFSGILNPKKTKEAKQKLFNYAAANNIQIEQQSIMSAGYNPPWTLPFLRRNEVLVDVIQ